VLAHHIKTNQQRYVYINNINVQARDYVHAKNGIMDLPPASETFQCLVANFSNSLLTLKNNQVIGVAEGHYITICTPFASVAESDQPEWEATLKQKTSNLSPEQSRKTFDTLSSFADMWDGHLGNIDAVQHDIVTEGPPVASQPYRAGPTARENINKKGDRIVTPEGGAGSPHQ
jgi:hypothetical protein